MIRKELVNPIREALIAAGHIKPIDRPDLFRDLDRATRITRMANELDGFIRTTITTKEKT